MVLIFIYLFIKFKFEIFILKKYIESCDYVLLNSAEEFGVWGLLRW